MLGPVWSEPSPDIQTMLSRAAAGDVELQNALGNAYSSGTAGVAQNFAEALKWYRKAAERGYAPAQFNVGLSHELGRGVPVDAESAFKYYLVAAEQGYAPAQFNVGNMYASGRGVGQDYFEANLWFKQAADNGVVEAVFNLGFAYEAGNGVKADLAQAARWYKQAAERGYARAQYNLALLLEDGRGVNKDPVAAAAYYRAAAEQGFAPAQVNYGLILSEGRPGVAADPVEAYVWLSRAAQSGKGLEARAALARRLDAGQIAAANRQLSGSLPANPPVSSLPSVELATNSPANASQLAPASGSLVDQLREQSRRLAAEVESLHAENAAAARQVAFLTTQAKDLQQELSQQRAAGGSAASVVSSGARELQAELVALKERVRQAEQQQAALAQANQRLQEENAALTSRGGDKESGPAAVTLANLQRDNARLNDEVKRSTVEMLALNSQLRALRAQVPAATEAAPAADRVAALQQQLEALQSEKAATEQWSQSLEKTLNEKTAMSVRLETDTAGLRQEKAVLEQQLRDRDQGLARLADENKALLARASRAEDQLKTTASAPVEPKDTDTLRRLESTERDLSEQKQANAELQRRLAAVQGDLSNLQTLRKALVQANSRVDEQKRELASLRAQGDKSGNGLADLQRQLADSNRALETSGKSVAELTALNDKLETELAAANKNSSEARQLRDELAKVRRDAADAGALREENVRLRREVADAGAVRTKAEQGTRDSEQLVAGLAASRRDLGVAQGRISELEKQLADATTVRTRTGDTGLALQAELTESNRTVEKLNNTVAELTAENVKLGKDLENAEKTAAAALAAQSQAVSAANNEAYQMEVSTLTTRIKELEAKIEQERAGAAREVLALANQLQLSRDANKSLSDTNRALVSAKESDSATVRADLAQLEGKLRDLTAINTELKNNVQKQLADLRVLTAERDSLQGQLQDARKVATVLPGLEDEKAALQEKLETATSQVARLQASQEQLQAANAKLTAGQISAEKVQADLVAAKAQLAESEKSADAHAASVAELTQLNVRLEQEKNDFRRLNETFREDIARLTQAAQAAEKQKSDALLALTSERDSLQAQLQDARKVATVLPGLAEEKAALQERLDAVGTQLVSLQGGQEQLRAANAKLTAQLAEAQQKADQAQADLAAVKTQMAEADKAADAHTASVAELTQINTRLEQEKEDFRRLSESYRGEIARLSQTAKTVEQQKVEAERSSQQNVDALTAQMLQLRRELDAARANQSRLGETYALQERDRAATIAQLRAENSALSSRLSQAQGTLDQIAAAARLGTPASTIASGGVVQPRAETPSSAEIRVHTVVEGDSLSRISLRYYGTANRWQDIYQANRELLQGSNTLRIGMQLRIP